MADFPETPEAPGEGNLSLRFPDDAVGVGAWKQLVENLPQNEDAAVAAFETFMRTLPTGPSARVRAGIARVFVSHQYANAVEAKRVAYLAHQEGYEHWLDVHNPALIWLNATPMPPFVKSVLIAAIVEVGLLNCSHVIALHTQHSQNSMWVPYELGRAKERLFFSDRAAGWFKRQPPPYTVGDYVHLAVKTRSESEIRQWLRTSQRTLPSRTSTTWHHGPTTPL